LVTTPEELDEHASKRNCVAIELFSTAGIPLFPAYEGECHDIKLLPVLMLSVT